LYNLFELGQLPKTGAEEGSADEREREVEGGLQVAAPNHDGHQPHVEPECF